MTENFSAQDPLSDPTQPRSPLRRSRRARWAVPAVVAGAVAVAVVVPNLASAAPSLPPRTAAQLLASVASAQATPMSGTVVETARLGLPALPETGGSAITLTSLLSGTHTARVWTDGKDKARVALVGDLAETDLIRNGNDLWQWTSGKNTAQHAVLPARTAKDKTAAGPATAESLTPRAAAARALAAVDPTTKVTVDGTATVAGRSAYELVLAPRDKASLVREVRVAVDSKTSVPLRVRVFSIGTSRRPAIETGFTSVTFAKPSSSVFRFAPPPGAKVTQLRPGADATAPKAPSKSALGKAPRGTAGMPTVTGTGWTTVVQMRGVSLQDATSKARGSSAQTLSTLTRAMTPVSGTYGTGRLLTTRLVSVLLLDDGRIYAGAVTPETLFAAAAAK